MYKTGLISSCPDCRKTVLLMRHDTHYKTKTVKKFYCSGCKKLLRDITEKPTVGANSEE